MRYRSSARLQPGDVGRRVTVRRRAADGTAVDVIGELVEVDGTHLVVRAPDGRSVHIRSEAVIAARVVPPRARRGNTDGGAGEPV